MSLFLSKIAQWLGAVVTAAGILVVSAAAEDWPSRAVKLIIPYGPGGSGDTVGRPWAEMLSQAFGQQFVVENRGGASGTIGTEAVVKSPPDGYTFLFTPNSALSILPSLRKVPYDPAKDLIPVARTGDLLCGFAVHPSAGVKTMGELLDYAKKNPGKLTYGSAGSGTATHLRVEMLKYRAGVNILHVPYRGTGEALNDLVAGNIQMMNEIVVLPHVRAGKLTLLAINHAERHPEFPDVPTLREVGLKDADVPIWFSVWAPAGTSREIVTKLNAKIVEIAKSDAMKARMRAISVIVPIQTPDEVGRELAEDTRLNLEVIKAENIKLEQ